MAYRAITRQAGQRLVVSLGMVVMVVSLSTALLYRQILNKANHERAADMERYFQSRLLEIESDWDLQSADFRVRLEVTRLLEDPATSAVTLQAFMTVQGTNRRFQHLLIQDRQANLVFAFGEGLTLERIPLAGSEERGWFQDPVAGDLYRVIVQPIWLGAAGTGRMALFYQLNNGLLQQMAAPGILLTALYRGTPVASSHGQQGIEAFAADVGRPGDYGHHHRELPWSVQPDDPTKLDIQAPVKALFSTAELALGVAIIPIIDALILWFALGIWLMRNSRRITRLGDAVTAFADRHELAPALSESLAAAKGGHDDEIRQVAVALDELTRQSVAREEKIRSHAETQKVLLQEVNHRVKNNLAAILGMLHQEQKRLEKAGLADYTPVIDELVGRIRGLAVVHSLLSATDWRPLPLSELCGKIVSSTFRGLSGKAKVELRISPSPVRVNSNQAHHLTMVINELTTNSLKHAAKGRTSVGIDIDISQEGNIVTLRFHDDGPGYSQEIINGDFRQTGIGFELITGIVGKSLAGQVLFNNDNGAVALISFANEMEE